MVPDFLPQSLESQEQKPESKWWVWSKVEDGYDLPGGSLKEQESLK